MELKLNGCNNYANGILERMNTFRKNGQFCDMIITVEEDKLYTSRALMAANSQYFTSMFSGNFEESSAKLAVVNLSKVVQSIEHLELCINALYEGSINLTEDSVVEIFYIGSYLAFDSIIDCCVSFMLYTLNLENLFHYYEAVRVYPIPQLTDTILDILKSRFHDVFVFQTEALNLSTEDAREMVSYNVQKYCTPASLKHFHIADYDVADKLSDFNNDQSRIRQTSDDRRPCLLLASIFDKTADTNSYKAEENTMIPLQNGVSFALYDIQNRTWLNVGQTQFPFPSNPDWSSTLVYSSAVFLNRKQTHGYALNLITLKWIRFSTSYIHQYMMGPLKWLIPTELGGSLFVLAVSTTLSFTSHMWIKDIKYFKITSNFDCLLINQTKRHCHEDTELYLLANNDNMIYFGEGNRIFHLGKPGIIVEESHLFDSLKEELQHLQGTCHINIPAYALINTDGINVVHDNEIKIRYGMLNCCWVEVVCESEHSEEYGDDSITITRNTSIWKTGSYSKFCNFLLEQTFDPIKAASYHPPPPYMNFVHFNIGEVVSSLLNTLTQATFLKSTKLGHNIT